VKPKLATTEAIKSLEETLAQLNDKLLRYRGKKYLPKLVQETELIKQFLKIN